MSSDYYFNKWNRTLACLNSLIELDLDYQTTKVHDQQCCDAARRLSGILGRYIACYNDALECLQHNLQVQKTVYIADVVKAIVARILELKGQSRKLEGAFYQFLGNGLIEDKLTPNDVEFSGVSTKYKRCVEINDAIMKAFQRAKEIKEEKEDKKGEGEEEGVVSRELKEDKWWEDTEETVKKVTRRLDMTEVYEVEEKISEETLARKQKVALIQAHEKTRLITLMVIKQKQRREKWTKELQGTLNSSARIEMRERGANLIQRYLRFYFELKRKKLKDCKRDELLQLRLCNKPSYEETLKEKDLKMRQNQLHEDYEKQRKVFNEQFKNSYFERKHEDIAEDIRDNVRNWFQKWYNEVKFFYDIPKEKQGGSLLILKEEVPSPTEWREKYKVYLDNKKSIKKKTLWQVKWEKQAEKEEEMMLKRKEMKKKKLEAELLKKMMKNPTLHPGFKYPASNKTEPLIKAIKKYYHNWQELDKEEFMFVKEKFVKKIDEENLIMNVKLEMNKIADMDMRQELKLLKRALKNDYKRNEEQMPEPIKEKAKRKKQQKLQSKVKINENIRNKLMDLAASDVLKEYPCKDFKDFLGDANFAGDSIRYNTLKPALHYGAETRAIWWETCRDVSHGFKRILLVGPRGCGKTTLVHIMATVNDAILYELDPTQVAEENGTKEYLQELVHSVAVCAKATQPSVIYIKHVHELYQRKVPPKEMNVDVIKRFFIRKLFKKIHRRDNVTIVGTCTDPWLSRSKQLLKKFPAVVLLPDTSYSAVYLILRNWVANNRIVPSDLDIHSLAYVLQGYSFGYLVKALDDFLTADRIVK
ncbi:IQ and AAA domain-containing protein 1-like isoform X2 [Maniola jurtina]|nr:IQ and AAA domain-containing protein 1-like isoform X2 [Maniola jurtina]